MPATRGTPLEGDRGAFDTVAHAAKHALDIKNAALLRHTPLPGVDGNYIRDNGVNWVTQVGLPLTDLNGYSRGVIIRGGAVGYEAYSAKTDRHVLIGDGTDVISRALVAADLTARGTGTLGRVAQFAAGGAAVEDANLVAPANLLTLVAAAPYTLTVPATGTVGLLGTAQTWTAVNTFDENILQADAKRIVTDEVRARDTDGLKLYNADGKGLRVGVGGHAAMGSGATSTAKILYLLEHFAGATSYGLDVEAQQHDDYTLYGGRFQATYTAAATGDKATGLHGLEVVAYNKSTHTVNVARGVHSYIRQNTTGTISQARGFVSRVDNPLGAIIYRYGFLCYDSPNTVNNRGLYVANLTGSGSVFAIYTNTGPVRFGDKVMFTQTDGNEAIDSLNDGYMDYLATTLHRFDNPLTIASLKSGATQAAAGAAATELWKTSSHATLPDNVAMIGV